jgi:hypothetical protein
MKPPQVLLFCDHDMQKDGNKKNDSHAFIVNVGELIWLGTADALRV